MPAGPAAPPGPGRHPVGDLDRRFYALAVDRLIAWSLFAGAGYLAWALFWDDGDVLAGVGLVAAAVVLVSLAFAVPLGTAGVSPGKALAGLRVVHDGHNVSSGAGRSSAGRSDGRPIGVGAALLRTLVLGAAAMPTLGLGLATLAWTAVADPGGRRRGVHDRLSHSVVVDVRAPAPEPAEPPAGPRPIVNLTAMRLVPAPPVTASTLAPTPAFSPAPSTPPSTPLPSSLPSSPPPPPPAVRPAPRHSAPHLPTSAVGPAWTVSFDTGESFRVEGLALVGRSPESRAGEPVRHLVPLRSADMSLSKTHAQFQVVPDGALVIMDRGSTNGSFVLRGGVSKPLTAGRPTTLLDGDTVRLGDRTMTVARG